MSSIESLPPRQREVLTLIQQLTDEHGYPPTLAELAKAMGLRNRMTVHQHVVALKKKGLVRWEPGLNRSLRVLNSDEIGEAFAGTNGAEQPNHLADDFVDDEEQGRPRGIPLAGTIAAGRPIDAIQTDEYLEVDSRYSDGCFALKIKGDSMIEDGIYDGDFVIIKPQPSPRNGEIVVATLEDGSATLKRFYKENGRYRLQPANSTMEPIYVDASHNLEIQGVVVALFRKMS
jgi:repressor LexA